MTAVADLRMTKPRVDLLRAVADPNIAVEAHIYGLRGTWSSAEVEVHGPSIRRRKVTGRIGELEAAGLVERAAVRGRYHDPRPYLLTDAGRQVLADPDAKKEG